MTFSMVTTEGEGTYFFSKLCFTNKTSKNWFINLHIVESRDGARHPTIHRTAPYDKEFYDPQCQQRPGGETLQKGISPNLQGQYESAKSLNSKLFKIEFLHRSNPNQYVVSTVSNDPVRITPGACCCMRFKIIYSVKYVKSCPRDHVETLCSFIYSLHSPAKHLLYCRPWGYRE